VKGFANVENDELYAVARRSPDPNEARRAWDRLVELEPARYLPERGSFYAREQQYNLARSDFESAASLDPNDGRFNLALFQTHHGAAEQALSNFEKVIDLRRKLLEHSSTDDVWLARQRLGWVYASRAELFEKLGLLDEALRDNAIAFDIDPGLVVCFSQFCERHSLWSEYERLLSKAIELKVRPFLLIQRAVVFEVQGDFKKAREDLDLAIQRFPLFAPKLSWSPKALAFAARAGFFKRRGETNNARIDRTLTVCSSIISGRLDLEPLRKAIEAYGSILH
jgi:tetratricopeptide (TPR) repeat protein